MGVWARVCLLGARLIGSGPFVARRLCAAFKFTLKSSCKFNGGKKQCRECCSRTCCFRWTNWTKTNNVTCLFWDEKKSHDGRQHAGLPRSIVVTFALDITFVLSNEIVVEPSLANSHWTKGKRWSLLFTPWGVDVELSRPQTNTNQRGQMKSFF